MAKNPKQILPTVGSNLLIVLLFIYVLFPYYIMITSSFKREIDVFNWPPLTIPFIQFPVTLDAYYNIAVTGGGGLGLYFPNYFLNSFTIAVGGSLLGLALGFPVAYALYRFPIKHKDKILFSFLAFRFVPPLIPVIAILLMYTQFGLLDNHIGMILLYGTANLPIAVLIMNSFMRQVPMPIIESSMMDGASEFYTMVKIMLPLAIPGVVATLILTLMMNWNEFPLAFVLTYEDARTVPTAIAALTNPKRTRWGMLFATGVLSVIPVVILAFMIQKHLVRGLTLGAVK